MAELGNVQPIKRITCPHCGTVLSDEDLEAALEGDVASCPDCGGLIRLPREVVARHQQNKYLGNSLDITG